MARREYLPPDERSRFDTPPVLTPQQRPIFLDLPGWAQNYLEQTLTPVNQLGFLLQLGYFRVVGRFFIVDRFHLTDIDWLSKQLKIEPAALRLTDYSASQTVYRQRQHILQQLGYEAFASAHRHEQVIHLV